MKYLFTLLLLCLGFTVSAQNDSILSTETDNGHVYDSGDFELQDIREDFTHQFDVLTVKYCTISYQLPEAERVVDAKAVMVESRTFEYKSDDSGRTRLPVYEFYLIEEYEYDQFSWEFIEPVYIDNVVCVGHN